MNRVVITGIGLICGAADNPEDFAEACANGTGGIRTCTVFDAGALRTDKFGEVPGVDSENRLYELMRRAGEKMFDDAGLSPEIIAGYGDKCRMFYGTLVSSADTILTHSEKVSAGKSTRISQSEDLPELSPDHSPTGNLALMNDFAAYAVQITGVKGMVDISSAACASGTTAVGMAFDYIRAGYCPCAIVGGADALNRLDAYGFHALKALSSGICNPFDEKHDGITIGESAVFLMAESLEHAQSRGAHVLCEICGYATGNDAYHITSPEPSGSEACHTMRMALEDAGITPQDVDYINAHGTGTVLNDTMEINAVKRLYGDGPMPHISSTKALTGHCMGSSGLIELASVIGIIRSGRPIRMPDLKTPLDMAEQFQPPKQLTVDYAVSNSFGFAGNSASVVVRRFI